VSKYIVVLRSSILPTFVISLADPFYKLVVSLIECPDYGIWVPLKQSKLTCARRNQVYQSLFLTGIKKEPIPWRYQVPTIVQNFGRWLSFL
jgi:hypothetical protein